MSKIKQIDKDNEEDWDSDEETGGMILEQDDIQLIHKALNRYKPTQDEEHLHTVLTEQFDELLQTDYIEIATK